MFVRFCMYVLVREKARNGTTLSSDDKAFFCVYTGNDNATDDKDIGWW